MATLAELSANRYAFLLFSDGSKSLRYADNDRALRVAKLIINNNRGTGRFFTIGVYDKHGKLIDTFNSHG